MKNNALSAGRFLVSEKDFKKVIRDGNANNATKSFRQTKQLLPQKRSCFVCMSSTSKRSRKSATNVVSEPRRCRSILMRLFCPPRNILLVLSRSVSMPHSSAHLASLCFVIKKTRKICGDRFVTKSGHSFTNEARLSCVISATHSLP